MVAFACHPSSQVGYIYSRPPPVGLSPTCYHRGHLWVHNILSEVSHLDWHHELPQEILLCVFAPSMTTDVVDVRFDTDVLQPLLTFVILLGDPLFTATALFAILSSASYNKQFNRLCLCSTHEGIQVLIGSNMFDARWNLFWRNYPCCIG